MLLATAGSLSAEVGVSKTEIVLGSFIPQSGPLAIYSRVGKGMEAYVKYINDKGGVHGRKIKLLMGDNRGKALKTKAIVTKMVEKDKVFALIGGYDEDASIIAKEYVTQKRVPWAFPLYATSEWISPSSKWILPLALFDDQLVVMTQYALDKFPGKKIGIIALNEPLVDQMVEAVKMTLEKKGVSAVKIVKANWGANDLSSQVLALKRAGAEIVVNILGARESALAVASGALLRYKPQWITASYNADFKTMHRITRGAWRDTLTAYQFKVSDYDDPTYDRYRDIFSTYYPGVRWSATPGLGVIFMEGIVQILEKCGRNLTREKFLQEALNLKNGDLYGYKIDNQKTKKLLTRSAAIFKTTGPNKTELVQGFKRSDLDLGTYLRRVKKLAGS